ncbi:MAG TPA: serine protease [Terriglobales bacterium]|jgi:S1-C subfamily serine protease|nr:serine protease [Terriglobales bacterium]
MDKIFISPAEVADAKASAEQPAKVEPKLAPVIPTWAKLCVSPLVLVLPLLCFVAAVLRVAMRTLPPRTRYGWATFMNTLLIVSGILTSLGAVVAVSFVPLPPVASLGLSELDERAEFPHLPATEAMSAKSVSESLKPLVAVITPAQRSWFTHHEMPSGSFGAGTLLEANKDGYLFVTAHHVLDGPTWHFSKGESRALIAMASGTWAAADVVARHKDLDLLLLWVPRESGSSSFSQPLVKLSQTNEGENLFVIGHPEGLRFTLSTGIISRLSGSVIQMSAPVSPGNSGGPVFDDKGNLVGIVTSMIDKHGDPNAENLNFAVHASALLEDANWDFTDSGRKHLGDYLADEAAHEKAAVASQH